MPNILYPHLLWIFGAIGLGTIVGCLFVSIRAAIGWTVRPVQTAVVLLVIGGTLATAGVVPDRYGHWLELGSFLAVLFTIGGYIGWALRDLADSVPSPASFSGPSPSATRGGSYIFRDAFAGMGADAFYMRTPIALGGVARERVIPAVVARPQAPAPGGYTFPKTLPFADATTSQPAKPMAGPRRHWSWPKSG